MTTIYDTYLQNTYGSKLNTEQFKTLQLIVNAFPENMLILSDNTENAPMFDLLAVLALMSGRSRELIKDMLLAHDIYGLQHEILRIDALLEADLDKSMLDNLRRLLVKYVQDTNIEYSDVLDGMSYSNKADFIMDKLAFFANESYRQRYRGSQLGIMQVIRDYLTYDETLSDKNLTIEVEINEATPSNANFTLDTYNVVVHLKDVTGTEYATNFEQYIDYSRVYDSVNNLYALLETSELYQLVNKYTTELAKLYIIAKSYATSVIAYREPVDRVSAIVEITNNDITPKDFTIDVTWLATGDPDSQSPFLLTVGAGSTGSLEVFNDETGVLSDVEFTVDEVVPVEQFVRKVVKVLPVSI